MKLHQYNVGDKIKVKEEKQRYTVRAAGERYLVCTKPFNLQATTIYTVMDFKEMVRGTENLVFPAGCETDDDCDAMLFRIEFTHTDDESKTEISRRNRVQLIIEG